MVKHVSRILLYGLVFFTPFLFVQNTNELFEFPKMYFVYFAGSLLIVVTVLGRFWGVRYNDRRLITRDVFKGDFSKLLGFFVGSFIVSTILSTHLYTSVWGYFSRFNGGLVSILIFFGIYSSFLSFRATAKNFLVTTHFLRVIALTIFPISIYAILQHFGLGGKWESDTTARAFSTFGQPNWYSAYCAMVLPIILYFGLEEKNGRHNETPRPSGRGSFFCTQNRIGWFMLFVLGFGGFWYSYSISGILGLGISLGLLLILNRSVIKKNWSILLVVAWICVTFALLNPGMFKQKISDAFVDAEKFRQARLKRPTDVVTQKIVVTSSGNDGSIEGNEIDNVATQYAVTDSGAIRKGIWKGALNLAVSSPKTFLIGTGPETFPYEFQKFRPTSLNYSSEWNYILNKPHNYYLELLTQNGVLGLLIYLAIVIKVLLAKHRFLTPALFGLFVTNIFSWSTVSTSLLFWIFLALLITDDDEGEGRRSERLSAERLEEPSPPRIFVSIVLITAYIFINMYFVKQYTADLASKKSQNYFDQGNVQRALDYADKSIKLNLNEPFYYRTRAKTYILQTTGQNIKTTNSLKALALKDILKAQELNPQNLSTLRGLVSLYYFLSLKDIGSAAKGTAASDNIDRFYLGITQNYYKNLSTNYPTDVGVLALVAKYQKMLGLTIHYGVTVGQIKVLRPDLLDWYVR